MKAKKWVEKEKSHQFSDTKKSTFTSERMRSPQTNTKTKEAKSPTIKDARSPKRYVEKEKISDLKREVKSAIFEEPRDSQEKKETIEETVP